MAATKPGDVQTQKVVLWAMILAVSMTTIDQTIVSLSATDIQAGLGISPHAITWSINAYILATAAFFLLGGKVADILGYKKVVIAGTAAFALFSLLCGLTPAGSYSEAWLITFRALQGVATAFMFPAALGLVYGHYAAGSRGKAMASFFGITSAMTALGPLLGGYLTQWTWRSIFWINIPVALISLYLIIRQKVAVTAKPQAVDWRGAALVAGGMVLSVLGFQQSTQWGWSNFWTWLCIAGGALLLVGFLLFEKRQRSPMLRLEAFRDRGFLISVLAILFGSMAFLPIFFFMSMYGQIALHLSALDTGLLLLEFFIGFKLASQWGGKLYDKGGARLPYILGGAIGAGGFIYWATKLTNLSDGAGFISSPQFWPTVIAGAGVGLMFSVASTDVTNRSVGNAYGEATGISQTAKNFGGALGIAVLGTLLSTQLTSHLVSSFTNLGATRADAMAVVSTLNGSKDDGSNSQKQFPKLTAQEQSAFDAAVSKSYAQASKPVFYGMSAAMAMVFVLGLFYPVKTKARQSSTIST